MTEYITKKAAIEAVSEGCEEWRGVFGRCEKNLLALPSAQPSVSKTEIVGDVISRRAALDAMETWDKFGCDPDGKLVRYDDDKHYIPYVHYEDMVHAIKHLPSARPGWIPCNRELPKESGDYLVTIKYGEKQYAVDYLEYNAYGKEWNDGELFGWIVTAWQPAPKPWEGGQE